MTPNFIMPKNKPEIVTVPPANYIAVRGQGDPTQEGGAYQQAIGFLYAVACTLNVSAVFLSFLCGGLHL